MQVQELFLLEQVQHQRELKAVLGSAQNIYRTLEPRKESLMLENMVRDFEQLPAGPHKTLMASLKSRVLEPLTEALAACFEERRSSQAFAFAMEQLIENIRGDRSCVSLRAMQPMYYGDFPSFPIFRPFFGELPHTTRVNNAVVSAMLNFKGIVGEYVAQTLGVIKKCILDIAGAQPAAAVLYNDNGDFVAEVDTWLEKKGGSSPITELVGSYFKFSGTARIMSQRIEEVVIVEVSGTEIGTLPFLQLKVSN